MFYALIGVAAGLLLGMLLPWSAPAEWSPYLSAALLAALAALMEESLRRQQGQFRPELLLAGFLGDAALAGGLAFLGDRLDVPLYWAAMIWFGGRIFWGFGRFREFWAGEQHKKRQKSEND